MTSLQFGYAGMVILTKISLNNGISLFVLLVYRHIIATLALAPFAFFIERKVQRKMTFPIFCKIAVLGLLGPLNQTLYYMGLKFSSPTFGGALNNLLPATTFLIALIFRLERINVREIRSEAKIVGTIVCVSGAMFMTLYKGAPVPMPWSLHHHHDSSNAVASHDGNNDMVKGCLFFITSVFAWSSLFVLQASVLKKYSAQLSLVTLICLMGTVLSAAVTLALERRPSAWAIGFDMNLLTAIYSGVMGSGLAYYVQGVCMRLKGPVFATAFIPLTMIITAIMDSIILHQNIYLGSVLGGVVIVIGLYGVLWGKAKDSKFPSFDRSEILPTCHSDNDKNNVVSIEKIEVPVDATVTFNIKSEPCTI
ncbi:WAT1-related protein At5g07050-like [Cryptomeria japonica]|uniref:WAT1-related protein At5g07050-like n=1 Tax=Cryptomeria japonica TaxID=3369 RepID=UPI0027D9D921|nr:WAT1-related protein At5g07050-like [Cryptomeria japonica]